MGKQHLTAVVGADTRRFNRAMGGMRRALKTAAIGIGAMGAAAAAGLVKATKAAIDFGDNIDKTSKKTGLGAEELQRYALAAELSGGSMSGLEKGMKRMFSNIDDANDGLMESKRVFEKLGISIEDMQNKTPEDALNSMLTALAGISSVSKRSAIAVKLFGRAGTEMLPMLTDGASGFKELLGEADKFNTILSQDQVKAAASAKDAMTRLQASVKALTFGAILTDGETLAEVVNGLAGSVAEFTEGGGMQTLNDNLRSMFQILQGIAAVIKPIVDGLAWISRSLEDASTKMGLTKGGVKYNQLSGGTGGFGAASTAELVLARLEMMNRNGVNVKPVGQGV